MQRSLGGRHIRRTLRRLRSRPHLLHQRLYTRQFFCAQQTAVAVQRRLRGQQDALGFDLFFAQGAHDHVGGGAGIRFLQHARHVLVFQAVRRFDGDVGFHAGTGFAGGHGQQAVGVDLVSDADAGGAGHHGRDAAQFKTGQRTAVGHQLALALQHVHGQGGLAIFKRRELLGAGAGDGRIAGDDFSTSPPMVSMPSDKGITSSSSQSSPAARLPASRLAWMAAPRATTLSGSILACGMVLKYSDTARRTWGMRVAPPTITTPSMSSTDTLASRMALRIAVMVLPTRCFVISANCSAVTFRWKISPESRMASIVVASLVDSSSFACRAFTIKVAVSSSDRGASLACSVIQQNRRWSKSSPPRAESPPVDSTSNTHFDNFRIEMSKVPPPRS